RSRRTASRCSSSTARTASGSRTSTRRRCSATRAAARARPSSRMHPGRRERSGLEHQRAYFERLAGRYADGYAIGVPCLGSVHAALSPRVSGRVLDVGNGGLACWDLARAERVVFADLVGRALARPQTFAGGGLRALHERETARTSRVGADVLA